MDPLLSQRYDLYGRLGDLWSQKLKGSEQQKARHMAALTRHTASQAHLISGMQLLAGQSTSIRENLDLNYKQADVIPIGANLQTRNRVNFSDGTTAFTFWRRPAAGSWEFSFTGHTPAAGEDDILLSTETDDILLMPGGTLNIPMPEDWAVNYLLKIPFNLTPLKLRAADGRALFAGADYVCGVGVLGFLHHPDTIFTGQTVHVASAFKVEDHPFNYTLQVDPVFGSVEDIATYQRGAQTPSTFLRALARACNFQVAPAASMVHEVMRGGGRFFYGFDWGIIAVDYPHEKLHVGDSVVAGEIIGQPISMRSAINSNSAWWAALDWSDGLSLDGLCAFPGLTAPNEPRRAYAVDEDDDVHVRIDLDGPTDQQDLFWASVKRNELLTGNYLNAVVGLSSISDVKFVNPLRLMFEYLLGACGIVITRRNVGQWSGSNRARFENFVSREKPLGSIIMVRDTNI